MRVRIPPAPLTAICSIAPRFDARYSMRRLFLREELVLLRTKTAADFLQAYLSRLQKHDSTTQPGPLTPTTSWITDYKGSDFVIGMMPPTFQPLTLTKAKHHFLGGSR